MLKYALFIEPLNRHCQIINVIHWPPQIMISYRYFSAVLLSPCISIIFTVEKTSGTVVYARHTLLAF